MTRFTLLVAAVGAVLPSIPAAAQPRGRAQADTASAPAPDDDDGPEARGVAVFKLEHISKAAVRLSPDTAHATTEREIARRGAGATGRAREWVLGAGGSSR